MPDPLQRVFHYLKSQNKIKSESLDEFKTHLENPTKLGKVFDYLRQNDAIKADNIDTFKTNFGIGGGDPTDRPLPKDVVLKYVEHVRDKNITPLVDIEEEDPLFYDRDNFIDFYRQKALKKFSPADMELYNNADPANRDAIIALRGGLPDFTVYQKIVRDYEKLALPSDVGRLPSGKSNYKPQGYRYNAGQGKPARDSITRRPR